ncbi:cytochrome b/b6 domain-containing protein [Pusillimonas sp. T7-7]|nr:cytochrome b/b6 domain-containing protein [Pusillimonas sp. T7-7]
MFVALVIGHIVAALYHHFVERDGTLQRMLG